MSEKDDQMRTDGRKLWHLAQLRPNSHALAERNLLRQGFETFLPQLNTTVRRSGRFVTELRPLFPGYIFVAFDPSGAPWRKINSTLGVSKLVSFGPEQPKPVPLALIQALQARCDQNGQLMAPNQFEVGENVEVKAGPFTNFVATVESITPDKRVWVLLDLLGRETRISLAPEDLTKT